MSAKLVLCVHLLDAMSLIPAIIVAWRLACCLFADSA